MRARGFTLLEIMVAVAILGLALTVILSAQAGLYSSAKNAQNETTAIGLVRCKMGEIEELLLRQGYPEMDAKEDGQCCEESPAIKGMTCSWKIERVELPTPATFGDSNAAGGDAGALSSLTGGSMGGGADLPKGAGALGALLNAGSNDAGLLRSAGGADGGIQALSSMMGGAVSGGVAGLAPMVMGIVYPSLKPMLEASIRKITVTVKWHEGLQSREMTVQQYLTNPMRGGLGIDMTAGMGSTLPGMPGVPGAPTSTSVGGTGLTPSTNLGGVK